MSWPCSNVQWRWGSSSSRGGSSSEGHTPSCSANWQTGRQQLQHGTTRRAKHHALSNTHINIQRQAGPHAGFCGTAAPLQSQPANACQWLPMSEKSRVHRRYFASGASSGSRSVSFRDGGTSTTLPCSPSPAPHWVHAGSCEPGSGGGSLQAGNRIWALGRTTSCAFCRQAGKAGRFEVRSGQH